jgi:hypothetical protein
MMRYVERRGEERKGEDAWMGGGNYEKVIARHYHTIRNKVDF